MKNLSKILLTGLIYISSFLNAPTLNAEVKSDVGKIAAVVSYNALRKEREYPTFQILGEKTISGRGISNFKDNYGKLKGREIKVDYKLSKNNNDIYYTIRPENYNKTNWENTNKQNLEINKKYSRINESSTLILLHDPTIKIQNISQQATFAKQNFWKTYQTSVEKKGLIELKKHKEAAYILETGEKIIDELVGKVPSVGKTYNKFIEKSKSREREDIQKISRSFGKNLNITIIPTFIPDKLTGQTMTSLEYKIKTNGKGKIFFYHITNFGNPSSVDNTAGTGAEGFAQIRTATKAILK